MADPDTLDKRNLLQLILAMAGETEVPRDFYLWSAMSLIAATLQNRVWYEHMAYKRIRPNLYVILVGPSGDGKGAAMGLATQIGAEACIGNAGMHLDLFPGRVTAAAIYDLIASHHQIGEQVESKAVWLQNDELSHGIRTGEPAREILKLLTDLWESHGERSEKTRGGDEIWTRDPVINWLAGSTATWLHEAVDFADVTSGFFARTVVIRAERIGPPIYKPDTSQYAVLFPRVKAMLETLWQYEGAMTISPEAQAVEEPWYVEQTAVPPAMMNLYPCWKRRLDIVHKFAMILQCAKAKPVASDWHVITRDASLGAINLYENLLGHYAEIIDGIVMGKSDHKLERVMMVLKKYARPPREIKASQLQRHCSPYGIRAEHMDSILKTLIDEGSVSKIHTAQGVMYQWIADGLERV